MSSASGQIQNTVGSAAVNGNLGVLGDATVDQATISGTYKLTGIPQPMYGRNGVVLGVGERSLNLIGPFDYAGVLTVVVNTPKSTPPTVNNVYASGVFHVFYDNPSSLNITPLGVIHNNLLEFENDYVATPENKYLDVLNQSSTSITLTATWSFLPSAS